MSEYQTTANAVSGAGVVILYAAFFAGHSLYQLFSLDGGICRDVDRDARGSGDRHPIRGAVHRGDRPGRRTGDADPALDRSGSTRGLLLVPRRARRRLPLRGRAPDWTAVTALALSARRCCSSAGTPAGWRRRSSSSAPPRSRCSGGIYLWHAARTRRPRATVDAPGGARGAMVPLGFAVLLAAGPRFAPQWIRI